MSCAKLGEADDLHRIPEHTTVPILGKEL